jgi:hypothetical protein
MSEVAGRVLYAPWAARTVRNLKLKHNNYLISNKNMKVIIFVAFMVAAILAQEHPSCKGLRARLSVATTPRDTQKFTQLLRRYSCSGTKAGSTGGRCFSSTSCGGSYCQTVPDRRMCFWRPPSCYDQAKCEIQADGNCGWTQTAESQACANRDPPPAPTA